MAVALLGLVVSVLARSAIQGMSYEGDASRRLRASLLADRALAVVESGLKLGAPPQLGHRESQEADEFQLSVDVQPLDLGAGRARRALRAGRGLARRRAAPAHLARRRRAPRRSRCSRSSSASAGSRACKSSR